MKKALCLALAAALLALAACAAAPAESMENTSAPAAQEAETETDHIRALLEGCGVNMDTTRFAYECSVNRSGDCTIYASTEAGGLPAVLVERPDGTAFYFTVPNCMLIQGTFMDEDGLVAVLTDGVVHGGDEIMHNGGGKLLVDPATGETVSHTSYELLYPEGVYGRECSTVDDHYTFGACTVTEDAVTFTFEPTEGNESWTGTELYFLPVWKSVEGERRMAVLFNNTAAPDPALAEQLEALPGVLEATFTEVDNDYYTGTLLEMRVEDKYTLAHSFNGGVPGPALESYTIRCEDLYPDGAPVEGEFVPDPEMEAAIAEKEQQALEKLGMADPTPAPESAGTN